MILSGTKIIEARRSGDISIEPFDISDINPNSCNFRLGRTLIEFADSTLPRAGQPYEIGNDGHVLYPGRLYLAVTREKIGSTRYVTTLLGRSSIGRLGLFLNATADLGHIGCDSNWTLELSVVQPLRVYSGMRIGQVAFWSVADEFERYRGRYLTDCVPTPNKDISLFVRHGEKP